MENKFMNSIIKAGKSLWKVFPMILGTILLISLIFVLIPDSFYTSFFRDNLLLNSIIGSLIGSVSVGNPVTSYLFGGEMLEKGISLIAVTAFIVSWVTVGIIQLPAESTILGKKFAILRNISSFILAIVVAIITVLIMNLISGI